MSDPMNNGPLTGSNAASGENVAPTETETHRSRSDSESPKYVTEDQLNKAISSHLKRLKFPEPEQFAGMIKEQLAGVLAPPKAEPSEIEQLKAQLAQQSELIKAEREGRKADKLNAARKSAEADLAQALATKVRPEAVPLVIDLMRARGALKVSIDEGAALSFGGVDYSIAEGVSEFLKTSEAAFFMPSPSSNNTTTRPVSPNLVRSNSKATKEERLEAARQNLSNAFKGF